jgi:hypothetical protein
MSYRDRPRTKTIPDLLKDDAISLIRKNQDFGPTLAQEKLFEIPIFLYP